MSRRATFTFESSRQRGFIGDSFDPIEEIDAIEEVAGKSFEDHLEHAVTQARKDCCDNPNCALIADYNISNEHQGTVPHQMAGGPDEDVYGTVAKVTVSCNAKCVGETNCVKMLSEHLQALGPACIKAVQNAAEKEDELLAIAQKEADTLIAPVKKEAEKIKATAKQNAEKERVKTFKKILGN